jgi:hypothetical protein
MEDTSFRGPLEAAIQIRDCSPKEMAEQTFNLLSSSQRDHLALVAWADKIRSSVAARSSKVGSSSSRTSKNLQRVMLPAGTEAKRWVFFHEATRFDVAALIARHADIADGHLVKRDRYRKLLAAMDKAGVDTVGDLHDWEKYVDPEHNH